MILCDSSEKYLFYSAMQCILYPYQCWGASTFFHRLPSPTPAPNFYIRARLPALNSRLPNPGSRFIGFYRIRLPLNKSNGSGSCSGSRNFFLTAPSRSKKARLPNTDPNITFAQLYNPKNISIVSTIFS